MIASVRQVNATYKSAVAKKKEEQCEEEQKKASEDRKRKPMISTLEQQKKITLSEMKAQAAAIDEQIASLKSLRK